MSAAPTNSAVEFDNVSIVFGDNARGALPLMDAGMDRAEVRAKTGQILGVHNASLTVNTGEIVVLMGLSGSGKSTLLRAVNGLNPVTRGEVRVNDGNRMVAVNGADARTLRNLRLHRVSMVFQQFGLLPWRTVRDNVGLGLELAGLSATERRAKVQEQLEIVGLEGSADRRVTDLSGGMQQRVGLARALVTGAPILLMDEPFSALDPLIRTKLQDELLALQERLKRTILFVSHDLDEAFKIGNRIAILEGGRIVQTGTPREIYSNPASDYVSDFVQNMNPLAVLTACDALEPLTESAIGALPAGLPIRKAMAALEAAGHAMRVVDGAETLGQISPASISRRLLTPNDQALSVMPAGV
ncbi:MULTISPECIES: choline ABC transporter ATP-binding protein [unclassified Haematobacter]|uniref:choline ABC transporter ATP-binding protein n=1 Tax=unclassified Haematobacter TaxID=2640585 RepID=UPI0025BB6428|nr:MULTISPECIES: choline ABC transporter ATP-binding protein [unclassified Haematobacter]